MARVALLDDYQGVALRMADWKSLPAGTEVVAFPDHLADESALAARLADFDIVMAMRERTPFTRSLPNIVVTPHLGYVTEETYRVFYGHALEDVQAFLRGAPVRVLSA